MTSRLRECAVVLRMRPICLELPAVFLIACKACDAIVRALRKKKMHRVFEWRRFGKSCVALLHCVHPTVKVRGTRNIRGIYSRFVWERDLQINVPACDWYCNLYTVVN